jgi:cephalosporin hydroxylase
MTWSRSGRLSVLSLRAEYEERLAAPSDIKDHLPFLHETALSYGEPHVIELGVREGNSTVALLAAIDEAGWGTLISADIAEPQVPEAVRTHPWWVFLRGDDLSDAVLGHARRTLLMPATACMLFIDTSHAYMRTLRELEAWVPFVRPGGTVLLHDTLYQPMPWEVRGIPQPPLPVMRAMREYCDSHGLTWENREGSNGLGVIKIPEGTDAG